MIITTEDTERENAKRSSCLPNALSLGEGWGEESGSTATNPPSLFLFFATLRALTQALFQRQRE